MWFFIPKVWRHAITITCKVNTFEWMALRAYVAKFLELSRLKLDLEEVGICRYDHIIILNKPSNQYATKIGMFVKDKPIEGIANQPSMHLYKTHGRRAARRSLRWKGRWYEDISYASLRWLDIGDRLCIFDVYHDHLEVVVDSRSMKHSGPVVQQILGPVVSQNRCHYLH